MGWTINGCGTRIVPARGITRWRPGWFSSADFDGLSCFCLFYMPLIPYDAVHAFDWAYASRQYDLRTGERDDTDYCRVLSIRWEPELVVRAYLRPWLMATFYMSSMFALGISFGILTGAMTLREALGSACFCSFLAAIFGSGLGLLWWTDQRSRAIRLVLGPAERYGGDPWTWSDDRLADTDSPRQLFGTNSYADAVPRLVAERQFARAMLAARLALATEHRAGRSSAAESLTDQILQDPRVQIALAAVRADPSAWHRVMDGGAPS